MKTKKLMIFLFATVISIVCFWASFKLITTYFSVKQWTIVKGQVLSKEIKLHEKRSSAKSPYEVKVNYEYIFNKASYKNDKVYLVELIGGQADHMKETAENVIKKISDQPDVYVNPNNPSESVLLCEGITLYFFIFAMGVLSLLIGIGNLVKMF